MSPSATGQLLGLAQPLKGFVATELVRLAEAPTAASERSPAPTRGQRATFKFDRGGAALIVSVTFLYGQDERTLRVENIAVEFAE